MPRAGRVGEEHAAGEQLRDLGVTRHLPALVPCERQPQLRGTRYEDSGERVVQLVGVMAGGQMDETRVAAASLDDGA